MRVRMNTQISGFRADAEGNYTEWPGRGSVIDLPDDEAVVQLRAGNASPENGGDVEEAIASADGVEDTSGIPVSLDSVPGPIDETAPEGVTVPKPNGEPREISSTERLRPEDHAPVTAVRGSVVTAASGPVISPDPTSPSGDPSTARKSSGLKPRGTDKTRRTTNPAEPVPMQKPDEAK